MIISNNSVYLQELSLGADANTVKDDSELATYPIMASYTLLTISNVGLADSKSEKDPNLESKAIG